MKTIRVVAGSLALTSIFVTNGVLEVGTALAAWRGCGPVIDGGQTSVEVY